MAKEIILRPFKDIAVGHEIPEGFTGVYQLINETEPDELETYINYSEWGNDTTSVESTVAFEEIEFAKKKVIEIIPYVRCKNFSGNRANAWVMVDMSSSVGGKWMERIDPSSDFNTIEVSVGTSSMSQKTYANLISKINAQARKNNVLDVYMTLRTVASGSSSKNTAGSVAITQAYLKIIYEDIVDIGIHDKINGNYKAATAAYQKHNGIWSEIHEDEAKTILNNNTIRRG